MKTHTLSCLTLVFIFLANASIADEPSVLDRLKSAATDAFEQLQETAGEMNDTNAQSNESEEGTVTEREAISIWHADLDSAIKDAKEQGKPIFAIVGAPWCSFCQKLEKEVDGKPAKKMAKKWVLAKINADEQVGDARELRANGLPALRLLSSDGITTVAKDGYMSASQLALWLDDNYDQTKAEMPKLLTKEIAELDEKEIDTLIRLMAIRDVTARRVVLSRIAEMPEHAAEPTVDMIEKGTLAEKLSALQLLKEWKAPIESIDPWDPKTISDQVVTDLRKWCESTFQD